MEVLIRRKLTIGALVAGIFVSTANQVFFCGTFTLGCVNPFNGVISFLEFIASILGISIFSIMLAIISSGGYVLIKKRKEEFWYYFALLFLIFSLCFSYIFYATRNL